jgi:hypothetical protein
MSSAGFAWFRWYHGSVTDPKFKLVAVKSGARVGDVISVWAYLLEQASAATPRGRFGTVDFESIDCLIDCEEGSAAAILKAMTDRGLVREGEICNWDKRQPRRERDDDLSTDRVRRFREKRRHETPCNAEKHHETPRQDKTIQDKRKALELPNGSSCPQPAADDEASQVDRRRLSTCPHDQILALFAKHLPDLPQPQEWSAARRKALAARWRWVLTQKKTDGGLRGTDAAGGLQFFDRFFAHVAKSDFLTGRDRKWQGCDLPWLLKSEKFISVIEGKYDNPETQK